MKDEPFKEVDYSRIEKRIMASVGIDASRDLHAETAMSLYGEVTPETLTKAKTINFHVLYGTPTGRLRR